MPYRVALQQSGQITVEPVVGNRPAIQAGVMRGIAQQYRRYRHGPKASLLQGRYGDAVAHAAVHYLRLNGNDVGVQRTLPVAE